MSAFIASGSMSDLSRAAKDAERREMRCSIASVPLYMQPGTQREAGGKPYRARNGRERYFASCTPPKALL